jgi:hypothetical protein
MNLRFRSNEALFAAVRELAAQLELAGDAIAAAELRNGLGYLNGLTDGWAHFLDSIERIEATHAAKFSREAREALADIRAAAHTAVYRR